MKPKFLNFNSEKRTFNIAIVNPDNGEIVPVDEWRKEQNPTRASVVCLNIGGKVWLAIAKCNADGGKRHNFDEANDIASKATFDGCDGATFRLPTRHECTDIYDARFAGLDDAVSLIGGDPLTSWFWTCESDPDPEYGATVAFVFHGYTGVLNGNGKGNSHTVRPVSAFELV